MNKEDFCLKWTLNGHSIKKNITEKYVDEYNITIAATSKDVSNIWFSISRLSES